MKKSLLLLAIMCLSLNLFGQTEQGNYYLYQIVSLSGSYKNDGVFKNEGIKVVVDNGKTIEKLKDKNGKKISFATPASALMYFISQGWELYVSGSTSSGASFNGTGSSSSSLYWIMRKPCTKEEFDEVLRDGVPNINDDIYL